MIEEVEKEFQEFILLYEELIRKETLLGSLLNPDECSGYWHNPKVRGIPKANETILMIYGSKGQNQIDIYWERKKTNTKCLS